MNKIEAQKIFEGANIKSKRALRKRYEELRKELSELLDKTEKIQSRIIITNRIGELDDAFMLLSGKKPYEKKVPKKTPVFVTIITIIAVLRGIAHIANACNPNHSRIEQLQQPNLEETMKRAEEFAKWAMEQDSLTKVIFNTEENDSLRQNDDDQEHN